MDQTDEGFLQWIVVDSKVYDVTRFKDLHPGGASVFLEQDIGTTYANLRPAVANQSLVGQDATEAFYGLHRHEVLQRPQYARLQIGTIKDEKSSIVSRVPGELSLVPYAEPPWLSEGYHSPYFNEV